MKTYLQGGAHNQQDSMRIGLMLDISHIEELYEHCIWVLWYMIGVLRYHILLMLDIPYMFMGFCGKVEVHPFVRIKVTTIVDFARTNLRVFEPPAVSAWPGAAPSALAFERHNAVIP